MTWMVEFRACSGASRRLNRDCLRSRSSVAAGCPEGPERLRPRPRQRSGELAGRHTNPCLRGAATDGGDHRRISRHLNTAGGPHPGSSPVREHRRDRGVQELDSKCAEPATADWPPAEEPSAGKGSDHFASTPRTHSLQHTTTSRIDGATEDYNRSARARSRTRSAAGRSNSVTHNSAPSTLTRPGRSTESLIAVIGAAMASTPSA